MAAAQEAQQEEIAATVQALFGHPAVQEEVRKHLRAEVRALLQEELPQALKEQVAPLVQALPGVVEQVLERKVAELVGGAAPAASGGASNGASPEGAGARPDRRARLEALVEAWLTRQVQGGGGGGGFDVAALARQLQAYQALAGVFNQPVLMGMDMATKMLAMALRAGVSPEAAVQGLEGVVQASRGGAAAAGS